MKKSLSLIVVMVVLLCGLISPIPNASADGDVKTASLQFSDISSSNTFYDEIYYLASRDVISGYPDGTFQPDKMVTRAQAAIMIGRAMGLNAEPRNTKFKDVSAEVSGAGYIALAVERGIIQGFPDQTFRPYQPVTRGQMAIFIDRAYTLSPGQASIFRDVFTNMTAYLSILNVSANGIASGYPDTTFRPDEFVTRGQFSAFLARTLEPSFRSTKPVVNTELTVAIENNRFQLNGVTLGLTKQEVIQRLGNPQEQGSHYEDYFLYTLKNTYDQTVSQVYFEFNNGQLWSIAFDANAHVINAGWYKNLGRPFTVDHEVTYFYLEGTEQLLMIKPFENNAYIVYAGNNFYYWNGMDEKMW